MEYDLDHRDSLHQVFDHLELPPWLTGTSKQILPEDLPNMSLNTMDALVSDNANSLKAADPAEDAEGNRQIHSPGLAIRSVRRDSPV